MLFSNTFNVTAKDVDGFNEWSKNVSEAIAQFNSGKCVIQPIPTHDKLEKWGVSNSVIDAGYGRYLIFQHSQYGTLPFWIGLALSKGNPSPQIAVTFDRKLLSALGIDLNALPPKLTKHAVIPGHCNITSGNTNLVEINLINGDLQQFLQKPSPNILVDFLDEVLNAL